MPKPKQAFSPPTAQSAESRRQNPLYPKPDIPKAFGDFLSPRQVTAAGLEVVVHYQSMKQGDVIALKFNGDDTFVPITVTTQKYVSFWVSVSHIIEALGTTVDIQYTIGGTSAGQKSDILQLTVLPFMEGELQMAKITEASPPTPGVLDLATFPEDAELKIAPWPLINAGQTVWLDLKHDAQEGTPYKIMEGEKVTPTQVGAGITRSIDRELLKKVPHESLMTLPLKVNFGGAAAEDGAVAFMTLELLVRQKGVELIEDFEIYPLGEKTSPFDTQYMEFKGNGLSIANANNRYLNVFSRAANNSINITLHKLCSEVTINIDVYKKLMIICHYDNGAQDVRELLPQALPENVFVHPNIESFTITNLIAETYYFLNNIRLINEIPATNS